MKHNLWLAALCAAMLPASVCAQSDVVNRYTVNWETPSENASGSMPIGNGEVGANVWMEPNGNLVFYLSRTDSWAENSALYKVGRLRVSLYPFPEGGDVSFRQFLNLEEGKIEIEVGNQQQKVDLDFWVDSQSPVVYLQGESTRPVQVTVSSEIWRTQARLPQLDERAFAVQRCPHDSLLTEYPDRIADRGDRLIVYHRNEHSIYPFTLRHQELATEENLKHDPLMHRTMGYDVAGEGFVKLTPTLLGSSAPVESFGLKIAVLTAQTDTEQQWVDRIEQTLGNAASFEASADRTASWWRAFWDKSYVTVTTPDGKTGDRLTQAYILQNWKNACGGRGNYPIKFNGSIFTVDPVYTNGKAYNPDYRAWGAEYWWQNTRLMYHPMLKSGDFDMMRVLFRHYFSNLPMLKRNAEVFFGAEGAVNPETSTIYGTFTNRDYGWDRSELKTGEIENSYVRYYWSSGLEIAALMYDYYLYTEDRAFVADTLVPMAREVLKFYDSFFPRDDQGLLRITPTHSLETYWDDVENDLPNVAGLHYVLDGLMSLPEELTSAEDRQRWSAMQQILPPVPTREVEGQTVFVPAEKFGTNRTNMEAPELYAIFPFPLCHVGTPDLKVGIESYNRRILHNTTCWWQDGQLAARLGLTDEARDNVLAKLRNSHPNHRFPVSWGPNNDWTPDEDHGGNLLTTLQDMILQSYGESIYVLPAFPKDWNVRFKLYTLGNNTVTGVYENGKWVEKPTLGHKSKQKIRLNR